MITVLFILHILVSALLCVVVLLQQSKGNGLAGAFGGAGAGEALFGARGVTTILHKATIYLGAAFMVLSLGLVMMGRGGSESNLTQRAADQLPTLPPAQPLDQPTALPLDDGAQEQPIEEAPEQSDEENAAPESGGEQ